MERMHRNQFNGPFQICSSFLFNIFSLWVSFCCLAVSLCTLCFVTECYIERKQIRAFLTYFPQANREETETSSSLCTPAPH